MKKPSNPKTGKKEHNHYRWALTAFVMAVALSGLLSLSSEAILENAGLLLALLIGACLKGGSGDMSTIIWIAAIVIFGVVEAATVGLVSIWFVIGSAAGLIAAVLDAPIWLQVVVFFIVSIAALIATRPLVRKLGSKGGTATNADRVLGGTARVTETIDNTIPSGEVYIDGKTWTARSESGAVIAPETLVKVIRLEGVKLYVDVPHNV